MTNLALRLAPSVRLLESGEATVILGPRRRLAWNAISRGERETLQHLASAAWDERRLAERFEAVDGSEHLPHFYFLLRQLDSIQALSRIASHHQGPLASLHPADGCALDEDSFDATRSYRISRFAVLARGSDWELSSPLGHARVQLHTEDAVSVVTALSCAGDVASVSRRTGIAPAAVRAVMEFAAAAGAIAPVGDDGLLAEDRSDVLRQWEFHDLLFHSRSRMGRSTGGFGGTFRFREDIPPLPALRPVTSASTIALHRPDLTALEACDPPFAAVLERRRSLREYGEPAMTADQLGELLFRVARVREVRKRANMEIALYNYPAGGASSELVFYPLVRQCSGLESALYRYDAEAHQLEVVRPLDDRTAALFTDAEAALGAPAPQVLLLIAARFQRVSWKYESMAYAAILKHVGVVLQTLYLAATAMNLAGCALGGGDSDAFASIAGTEYFEETTVGEFAIGSAP